MKCNKSRWPSKKVEKTYGKGDLLRKVWTDADKVQHEN